MKTLSYLGCVVAISVSSVSLANPVNQAALQQTQVSHVKQALLARDDQLVQLKGYITKGAPVSEMVRAIKKVMQGGKYFSADIAEQLASSYLSDTQQSPFDSLSEREMQVAMMVVNCISAQEIADKLFVSVKTVNTYRYRIFEKLNIDSDVKLTHLAIRYGLIKP